MPKLLAFSRPFILQPHRFRAHNRAFTRRNFFLSFSDALLCIFKHFHIAEKTEYILVPNFYCPDTLQFFSKFFKLVFYGIDNNFSVDKDSYFSQLKKFQPRVIVNYSFTGFSLTRVEKERLKKSINERTIIIEDFAHGLLTEQDIDFISPYHFYIDSIRKHSPFLGGHLVGPQCKYRADTVKHFSFYKVALLMLQLMKGLISYLAYALRSNKFYQFYDHLFLWQDAHIGSHDVPVSGSLGAFYLYNCIDLPKLKKHQRELAGYYNFHFNKIKNPSIKTLSDEIVTSARLAYYPLFVEESEQEALIDFLKKKNMFIEKLWEHEKLNYPELNRGLYQSFLIFPLTWLIKEKDVARMAKAISNYFYETAKNMAG